LQRTGTGRLEIHGYAVEQRGEGMKKISKKLILGGTKKKEDTVSWNQQRYNSCTREGRGIYKLNGIQSGEGKRPSWTTLGRETKKGEKEFKKRFERVELKLYPFFMPKRKRAGGGRGLIQEKRRDS